MNRLHLLLKGAGQSYRGAADVGSRAANRTVRAGLRCSSRSLLIGRECHIELAETVLDRDRWEEEWCASPTVTSCIAA